MRAFANMKSLLALLCLLLLGQLLLAARRERPNTADYLTEGEVIHLAGEGLYHERWRALLVVDSECPYCEQVAPQWAQWLRERRPFDRILIASAADSGLTDFLQRHDIESAIIRIRSRGPVSSRIQARTPWLFLLGPGDTLQWEGHGTRSASLDSTFEKMTSTRGRR